MKGISPHFTQYRRYFFLNGKLHKMIYVDKAQNLCHALLLEDNKLMSYIYSDVKKMHKKAFTIGEVALLVNRHKNRIREAMDNDSLPFPQSIPGKRKTYMWSEDEVLDVRDYFASVHRGRPRKDGISKSWNVPTIEELRSKMLRETTLYVQNDEGKFIPLWKAEGF
jgi:hypothetical protein